MVGSAHLNFGQYSMSAAADISSWNCLTRSLRSQDFTARIPLVRSLVRFGNVKGP